MVLFDVNSNPYAPSETSDHQQPVVAASNRAWGPAIYIVAGGLIAAILAAPYHSHLNPVGLAITPFGTIAGGLLYRARSRNWPVDPCARGGQLVFCAVAIILIPAVTGLLAGLLAGFDESAGGVMIIGLIVGVCMVAGILTSGVRRPQNAP